MPPKDWVRTTSFMVLSKVCRQMASWLGGGGLTPTLTVMFLTALGGSCGVFKKKRRRNAWKNQLCFHLWAENSSYHKSGKLLFWFFSNYACIPLDFSPLPPHSLSPQLCALGCLPNTSWWWREDKLFQWIKIRGAAHLTPLNQLLAWKFPYMQCKAPWFPRRHQWFQPPSLLAGGLQINLEMRLLCFCLPGCSPANDIWQRAGNLPSIYSWPGALCWQPSLCWARPEG